MPIETGSHPTEVFQWVVWNQEQQDLADITELIGWTPPEVDGVLYVRLSDGSMQPVKKGWAVYRLRSGRRGVLAEDVVAGLVRVPAA